MADSFCNEHISGGDCGTSWKHFVRVSQIRSARWSSLFMVIIVNKKHHHHHHHHHCGHDQHGHIRGLAEIGWKYIVTAAWRWSLPLLSHPLVNTEDNFVTCFHTQLEHTEHTEENTVCIGGIFDTRKTQNTNMITLWRCDLFWCILYKPINQYNWGCDQKSETTECH